jgi:hypothetical protein
MWLDFEESHVAELQSVAGLGVQGNLEGMVHKQPWASPKYQG